MSGPVAAILLTTVIHVIAFVVLLALMGRDMLDVFRSPPADGGDGGEPPASEPASRPSPGGGGLPLPDADQAPVRLREPGRIGDRYPRPSRRPDHEPARIPQRA
jgi:hypothetical protein